MAVCKSHGRLLLPSPPGEPAGAAYQPAWLPDETVTVTVAVPVFPSLVAVIVGAPAARPVTSPVPLTVASARLPLAQVIVRPVSTLPAESFVVAASCAVPPTNTLAEAGLAVTNPVALTVATVVLLTAQVITRPVNTLPAESFVVAASCAVLPTKRLAAAGVTVTNATGTAVVVTVAVPLCPSLVAVNVAVPAATAVTRPLADTVATPGTLLAHVTTRPISAEPFASSGVAVSWTVCPTGTLAEAGFTATDATGTETAVTITIAVPLLPSLVAVSVAEEPAATPVTSPLPLTVATPVASLTHVTTRPVNGLPFASWGVAVSCTVCPTGTLAEVGLTATAATGMLVIVTAAVSASDRLGRAAITR